MPRKKHEIKPDDISKSMFAEELHAARKRAGSIHNLSMATGYQERRLAFWLEGKGPPYPIMQEAYFKMKEVPEPVVEEIKPK